MAAILTTAILKPSRKSLRLTITLKVWTFDYKVDVPKYFYFSESVKGNI